MTFTCCAMKVGAVSSARRIGSIHSEPKLVRPNRMTRAPKTVFSNHSVMKRLIKQILKAAGSHLVRPHLPPLPPDARTSASAKAAMVGLMLRLQSRARAGKALPRLSDSGFRVFSQFELEQFYDS